MLSTPAINAHNRLLFLVHEHTTAMEEKTADPADIPVV
jgi:hypothetical protein